LRPVRRLLVFTRKASGAAQRIAFEVVEFGDNDARTVEVTERFSAQIGLLAESAWKWTKGAAATAWQWAKGKAASVWKGTKAVASSVWGWTKEAVRKGGDDKKYAGLDAQAAVTANPPPPKMSGYSYSTDASVNVVFKNADSSPKCNKVA
jgi:hypothetical protein